MFDTLQNAALTRIFSASGRPAPQPSALPKSLVQSWDTNTQYRTGSGPKPSTSNLFAIQGFNLDNQPTSTNLQPVEAFNASVRQVELINDFVAQGYGMLTLGDDEVTRLNDVEPEEHGTIACVGAGTGGPMGLGKVAQMAILFGVAVHVTSTPMAQWPFSFLVDRE